MSKIQDALRKLQKSERLSSSSNDRNGAEIQKVARVVRSNTLARGDEPHLSDHAVVTVDYDQLREVGLLAPSEQQRHIADQYRLIKRPLLDNIEGRGAHVSEEANLIMVASPLPGDGKTFNCINLALSIATEKDKSVLLVDADVAKPHITSLFGLEEEPGLIDLLKDDSLQIGDVLLKTNVPGLRVLPAGRPDEHATELLASRRMAKTVEFLSTAFPDRVAIFDSPPLLATSEARVLASLMGQIVLVVCASRTPQAAVVEAAESLDPDKANSIILNRANRALGQETYGYGYGYKYESPSA